MRHAAGRFGIMAMLCLCMGARAAVISNTIPIAATTNESVAIYGSGFLQGVGGADNVASITFNGIAAGHFTPTINQINTAVPVGATTGPIVVTLLNPPGQTVTSPEDFIVIGFEPFITSFDPVGGPVGTEVTVYGTHFNASGGANLINNVWFNGRAASSFTANILGQVKAIVPAGATTGPITVASVWGSNTSSANFHVTPVLTGFSPTNGLAGTSVTVTGTNFTGTTEVKFGNVSAGFGVLGNTSLQTSVPPGARRSKITVTTPGGSVVSANFFLVPPKISAFFPAGGPPGTNVTINGTNFLEVTSVTIGGATTTFTTNALGNQLVAPVPAGATNGPIAVTTLSGTDVSLGTFYLPPVVTSFTPGVGVVGDFITISGSNFSGATAVAFNGASALFAPSGTQLITQVPAGARKGKISVTTPGGTGQSANDFLLRPIISSFSPGATSVASSVTITGQNFFDVTSVSFGGVNTGTFPSSPDGTQIFALVPVGASNGFITVTTTSGATNSSTKFYVTPSITSFSLNAGLEGDLIYIGGKNLFDVVSVKFNGVSTTFITNSVLPGQLIAPVPHGALTGPITVQTLGGIATTAPLLFNVQPRIDDFTPKSAPYGDTVFIYGTNFTSNSTVIFSSNNFVNANYISLTEISAIIPTNAITGALRVATDGGVAVSSSSLVIQTFSNILLTVRPDPAGFTVSWPTNIAGWRLQFATNPAPPPSWSDNSSPTSIVNGKYTVTNNAAGALRIFRLVRP